MSSTGWIDLSDYAKAEVVLCVYVSMQPHDMLWRQWEINEGRKIPIRLYGTLILSFLQCIFGSYIYSYAYVCNILMHCLKSPVFQLHVGQDYKFYMYINIFVFKKKKALKKMPIFVWRRAVFFPHSPLFLSSFCSFSPGTQLERIKARSLREHSYCRLNRIKGRSAFKCLLFPWANRLCASALWPLPKLHCHKMQLILSGYPDCWSRCTALEQRLMLWI